jgi:hypothetical protein
VLGPRLGSLPASCCVVVVGSAVSGEGGAKWIPLLAEICHEVDGDCDDSCAEGIRQEGMASATFRMVVLSGSVSGTANDIPTVKAMYAKSA